MSIVGHPFRQHAVGAVASIYQSFSVSSSGFLSRHFGRARLHFDASKVASIPRMLVRFMLL
jgi:hypothetical protein